MDANTAPKNDLGTFKITGNWATQSKMLQEKFPQLTDEDVKFEPGKENDLITRLEQRLNKKSPEIMNILKKGLQEPAKA
jgi:hypothetical protein